MSEQEVADVWSKMQESPFRKLYQFELEKRLLIETSTLSTATPDKVLKQQGIVEGINISLAILARKDRKQST